MINRFEAPLYASPHEGGGNTESHNHRSQNSVDFTNRVTSDNLQSWQNREAGGANYNRDNTKEDLENNNNNTSEPPIPSGRVIAENVHSGNKPDHAYFKLQKKGDRTKHDVLTSRIQTWNNLTSMIEQLYGITNFTISTYEGDLVSQTNFKNFVVNKQHLIVSVPFDSRARNEALRALTEQIPINIQSPDGPSSITSIPVSPQRAEFDARHQKLNRENQSVKALAEQVRLMAEQTLRQYEEEGVEVMPTNQMRTPTGSESTPQYFTPPQSSRYHGSLSPNVSAVSRSPSHTPGLDGQHDNIWNSALDPRSTIQRKDEQSKPTNALYNDYRDESPRTWPKDSLSPHPYTLSQPGSRPTSSQRDRTDHDHDDENDNVNWSFSRDPNVYYPASDKWSTANATGHAVDLRKPSKTADERLEQLLSFKSLEITQNQEQEQAVEHDRGNDENFNPQSDHIDNEEAQHILLCPHITFHTTKPINLQINITPTITVIPPSVPQAHERFFATSIGERLNVDLALRNNGKITEITTMPEGDAQQSPIILQSKLQSRTSGPRYYLSRMEAQQAGAWGDAEVGELGGHGDDGKKRNGGEMVDFAFKGEENARRSFALAFDKVGEFIELFMDTCGFPQRERDTMRTFWCKRLPKVASKTHFLLVKLVPVKTMASLLPIKVSPEPDRVVRFFLLMRIASMRTIKEEGLEISGVMSDVVYEVLDAKERPLVPMTRGARRGRGRGGSRGVVRRGGISRTTPDRKVVLVEQPSSGLTVFEYGGLILANKDMSECDMPKVSDEESCENPFPLPVQQTTEESSSNKHTDKSESDVNDDDYDDEMDTDSDQYDSENMQQDVFSPNETASTAPSGYDPAIQSADIDHSIHNDIHYSANTLPASYWSSYSFPQLEQKFNFGDYMPDPTSYLQEQPFSPRDIQHLGFDPYAHQSNDTNGDMQNQSTY